MLPLDKMQVRIISSGYWQQVEDEDDSTGNGTFKPPEFF